MLVQQHGRVVGSSHLLILLMSSTHQAVTCWPGPVGELLAGVVCCAVVDWVCSSKYTFADSWTRLGMVQQPL
jgi:hypothetical protein